ncbi:XRE family transcriptional regulator [Arthrobacter sp. Soc17.1.1.1]|uniref:helix-turn-helix domain-containing protein n=1 Tax=Arthrobacter sp. Soc17.1.1.1 TaxID=3121277 RepID=UPI002FE4BF27
MTVDAATLARAIGERVKDERLNRRLTLDQLAETTGVSRRMIINIEQGATNPSVGTLLKISDALGVGLPKLVEPPRTAPRSVTRRGEGAALWTGDRGGTGVLMAGTRSPDVLELWDWTLEAQEQHTSEAHAAGTMEVLQVQQGALTVTVAGEPVALGEGDALTFAGDVDHSYVNHGDTTTRFTLAVFEPGVGSTQKDGTHD